MKRLPPDRRPSWRDPSMPVLRDYKMGDGSIHNVVDPDYERRYREHLMATATTPDYKDDPTYNLNRRKVK